MYRLYTKLWRFWCKEQAQQNEIVIIDIIQLKTNNNAYIREVIEETNNLAVKYREARDSEEMNRVLNQTALDTNETDLAVYVNLSIRETELVSNKY